MKKGDLRKQEILSTAEILFCKNGYEQTSIQDILDQLNSSKGSFYHHFVSKEALLKGICGKRARQIFDSAQSAAGECDDPVRRLNLLLSGMIPLRDEKLSFILMFLPIFRLPEGRMIKACYCDSLADLFLDPVAACLEEGQKTGVLCCGNVRIAAGLVLTLVNHFWVLICEMILQDMEMGAEPDLSEYLRLAEQYRLSVERILSLPYGSAELIDIRMLKLLIEQIQAHWAE